MNRYYQNDLREGSKPLELDRLFSVETLRNNAVGPDLPVIVVATPESDLPIAIVAKLKQFAGEHDFEVIFVPKAPDFVQEVGKEHPLYDLIDKIANSDAIMDPSLSKPFSEHKVPPLQRGPQPKGPRQRKRF